MRRAESPAETASPSLIEPHAAAAPERFPHIVASYGIECNQWMADWCERVARELEAAEPDERRTA